MGRGGAGVGPHGRGGVGVGPGRAFVSLYEKVSCGPRGDLSLRSLQ